VSTPIPSPAGRARAPRVFVGRERELAELEAHLAAASAGHGGLVLLGGEPGVGKTRLLDELAARARDRGMVPLWGRCWEEGGAPPYWPWVQVLRAHLRRSDAARVVAELGPQAAVLATLLPELASPSSSPIGGVSSASRNPEHKRFLLFDAVAACLRAASTRDALLVLLDDVHAADRQSLRLLGFLGRELRGTPVLVACAHREAEVRASPPVADALAQAAREGAALHIAGFPERDVARFVETRAGVRPSAAVVAALHRQTGGNPFFLDEVVHLLGPQGRLTQPRAKVGGRLGVPVRIRDAVEHRLEPLSVECRTVLDTASVIGLECTLRQLGTLVRVEPAVLLGHVDEAVGAGIVTAARGAGGRVRFVHALFREALYDGLPAARRVALHADVGRMMEQQADTPAAELAHHFLEASEGGAHIEGAVEYARRAAAEATARLAYEEAAQLAERALQALDLHDQPDAVLRGELLVDLGEARQRMGALDAARVALQDAVAIARRLDPALCGPLLARASLALAGVGPEVGRVDGALVELLDQALHVLDPADGALRARLLARLASELSYAPVDTRRHELGAQAVAMAERVGDPAALGYALVRRLIVLLEPGNAVQRQVLASSILDLARRTGDRELAAEGRGWRLFAHLELGDLAGVEQDLDALCQLAEETRHPHYRWLAAMFRAMRALLGARFDDAERLAADALVVGQAHGNPNAMVAYGSQLYVLRWGQGRLEELEPLLDEFVARHASAPVWESANANLLAQLGRLDEARRRFEPACAAFLTMRHDVTWLPHLGLLAEACAAIGDRTRAAVLYDLLRPFAGQHLVTGPGAACLGAAARPAALLAAALERWDEALALLDEALDRNERLGALAWIARTLSDRAGVLMARGAAGDHETAATCIARARALAVRLDLRGVTAAVERLAARLGAEPAATEDAPHRQVLRHEGDHWTVEYAGRSLHLRDSKGIRLLAHLLSHPGLEFHAAVLAAAADGRPDAPDPSAVGIEESERYRVSVTRAIHGLLARVSTAHPGLGEHLARTVRTGTLCSYGPDPRVPTVWELRRVGPASGRH
jgi:tetratricopeptide (TPR) repeat protein